MSILRVERWEIPAAELGPENPLPPLQRRTEIHEAYVPGAGLPEEIVRNLSYGRVRRMLPYTIQDGYGRELRLSTFRVAVLQNEILRAAFLLELGGRLWSLVHRPSGRELLYRNPVIQFADLGLRNAWFCGGVEWNVGTIGHSPFTCSPLYAARVDRPDGTPVLRMYEWERFRDMPFQIDVSLPDGSPVLFVRVRLHNPNDGDVPAYWWSNIAVPERSDVRVIVPAVSAFGVGPDGRRLARIGAPEDEGRNYSYPVRTGYDRDWYFDIPRGSRPWIAALDGEGRGLIETSTARLAGRKLFVWGMGRGGRKWQRFLSPRGGAYLELQAGLAKTQMEHLAMPAGSSCEWLEAYGFLEVDPGKVHGDWGSARRAVESALDALIPRAELEAQLERSRPLADAPPVEILQRGSGWGALETLRRKAAGEPSSCSPALVFDRASLQDAQKAWLSLLETGAFPEGVAEFPPGGFLTGERWRELLETAVHGGSEADWRAWLHLGIMRFHEGLLDAAQEAWKRSMELAPTPWALRNLAVLAAQEGRPAEAAQLSLAAVRLRPGCPQLLVECGRFMMEAGRPAQWLALVARLSPALRSMGRIRLLEAQAALAIGDLDCVERFLADEVIVQDIREGENSLSDLWDAYQERLARDGTGRGGPYAPLPEHLDFRLKSSDPA
ncbi:MAG: DUF5107 domain-containing protein [Planctomycetota bacterium]